MGIGIERVKRINSDKGRRLILFFSKLIMIRELNICVCSSASIWIHHDFRGRLPIGSAVRAAQ